jgi:hypothetical protein
LTTGSSIGSVGAVLAGKRDSSTAVARERWLVIAVVTTIVIFRSGVFVFWPQAHFDSDSAITGLMATHISEGRAFPVFWYGQSYMLAVESYLAAPLFVLFGASVTALKLPLLAINLTIALLLLRIFEHDGGLRPWRAAIPVLFFALPAPGTAARILEANGGNVEPFLYIVLLWITRRRPIWGGLVLGIGFLHREFTLYGLVALLIVEAFQRQLFNRPQLLRRGRMLGVAAGVWLVVQWVKPFSSAAGPGTTLADVYKPQSNVLELLGRVCLDIAATTRGLPRLTTEHWPVLFGTQRVALVDFGIDSSLVQGLNGSWLLLSALLATAVVPTIGRLATTRTWIRDYDVSLYCVLVAALSLIGYVVGRCGEIGFYWMRYDLMALLGPVGISAWFLQTGPPRWLGRAWMVGFCAWLSIAAITHGRLWIEYLTAPPAGGKQMMIRQLEADGTRYVLADYWIAYTIAFLTNERITAASTDFVRIPEYGRIVGEHRSEAIRISRTPCPGGREVMRRVWFCRD